MDLSAQKPETVTIKADGSINVVYRYKRTRHKVTYIDIDSKTGTELGRFEAQKPYGTTIAGSDIGSSKEPGAYYDGYVYASCTSKVVGKGDNTVYRRFEKDSIVPGKPDDVPYMVIHQEEQPDGSYETVETEELKGGPGTEVTPEPKEKEGFVTPPKQTVTINPDGTTEVTYKYEREKCGVTYIDVDPDSGKELGKTVEEKPYGATVHGSDIGDDSTPGAYYEGYSYDSCTDAVVAKEGTVVYRHFKNSGEGGYKVVTKEEQPDGTYKDVETEIIPGKPGDKVTVYPKPIEGFKTLEPQEIVINPDGSATVVFEYERESYEVTYVDMVKGTAQELGRSVEKAKFGYTVSGSDKGSDKAAGKYYAGYAYDSCTKATVGVNGAKVYRYFVKSGSNVVTNMAGNNGNGDGNGNGTGTSQSGGNGTNSLQKAGGADSGNGSGQTEKVRTGEHGIAWIFGIGALLAVVGCLMTYKRKKKK